MKVRVTIRSSRGTLCNEVIEAVGSMAAIQAASETHAKALDDMRYASLSINAEPLSMFPEKVQPERAAA